MLSLAPPVSAESSILSVYSSAACLQSAPQCHCEVKTEGREKPTIPITKHIERLKAGQKFDEMFKATDLIHDGGDQCRIRKVRGRARRLCRR